MQLLLGRLDPQGRQLVLLALVGRNVLLNSQQTILVHGLQVEMAV